MSSKARHVFRLVATPITLLILVAILLVAAKLGMRALTAPPPSAKISPCVSTDVGGTLKSSDVVVSVFNGSHERGLAGKVSKQLTQKGFQEGEVSNTDERIKQTIIVGHSKDDPQVKLIAAFFPKAMFRADPDRPDHAVRVLVGSEFGGFNAKAATSISVAGPVCLPPAEGLASPSATPSEEG